MLHIGIQLYSLRDYTAKDFFGTLEEVKKMGYDCVEFAGYGNIPAADMKAKLDELGLTAPSSHLGIQAALPETVDASIDYLKTVGAKYFAFPSLPEEFRYGHPDFEKNIGVLKTAIKKIQAAGLTVLYHNHSFEFDKVNGKIPLDELYAALPAPLLQPEFDTCWVKFAGYDPVAYINKYAGHTPVIHLKDFYSKAPLDRESLELRPLGYGVQDIKAIIEAGIASGCDTFIYEQDSGVGRTQMEAARLTREYLKSIGY